MSHQFATTFHRWNKRVSSWDFPATFGKINKAIKNYFVSHHEFCFNLEIMEQNCNTFGARSIRSIIDFKSVWFTVFRNKNTWGDEFKTVCLAFWSNKDNKDMFKIAFLQVFDIFNVNLRKNEGFLPCFPCNPIPEYGQSNAPLVSYQLRHLLKWNCFSSNEKHCRNKN